MNYKRLAEKLHNAGFGIIGIGYFDLTRGDMAEMLEVLITGSQKDLNKTYDRLQQKRMG